MDVWIDQWGLAGLFISAFVSSTLLPGGSEALLVALVIDATHSKASVLAVATIGNTLGGMVTWLMGFYCTHWLSNKPLMQARYQKAMVMIQRRGSPALLLAWLPVIGDPLCFVAGWVRINGVTALLFIFVGKLLRYVVLVAAL